MSLIMRVSRLIGGCEYAVELRRCEACAAAAARGLVDEHPAALVYRDGELLVSGHTNSSRTQLDAVVQAALSEDVYDKLNVELEEAMVS